MVSIDNPRHSEFLARVEVGLDNFRVSHIRSVSSDLLEYWAKRTHARLHPTKCQIGKGKYRCSLPLHHWSLSLANMLNSRKGSSNK